MNYYMAIAGVDGPTLVQGVAGFERCFEIHSFSFGAAIGGGAARLSELNVALTMGKGIPTTLLRLGNQTPITQVTIVGLQVNQDKYVEREKYRIETVKITGQSVSGSGGESRAMISLSFSFNKLTEKVIHIKPDGIADKPEQFFWDHVLNKGGVGNI